MIVTNAERARVKRELPAVLGADDLERAVWCAL